MTPIKHPASSFAEGGGAMGAEIRRHDWGTTPLGPLDRWSAALRIAVDGMLASTFPCCLFWGPDLIAVYNDGYRIILANKPALGLPLRVTWAEVWDDVRPIAEKALAGVATYIEDFKIRIDRRGHDEDAYFTFCYSPVFDENGGIVGMLDTVVETTDKVLADLKAREERDRQHRLLQQMPGFVAVLEGPRHVFTYVNDAYVRISGPRSFLGRGVREVFPELEGQGFYELLDGVYATGEPVRASAVPIELAGETQARYIDLLYEPIRSADGRVTGIFVGGYDVTERKRVETALLASEQRLRELNANLELRIAERALARGKTWQLSPELLGVLNSEGHFEATNPAWAALLGWSEAELARTVFDDFIHPDDRERSRQAWHDAIENSVPALRFENRCRTRTGHWRWLSWVAVPEDGKLYCSARDIQEEKERQALLNERTVERDVLARIVETTDVFIQVLDPDLRFVAINPANADEYMRVFGRRPKIGETLGEVLHGMPEHLAQAEALWRRAFDGEPFTIVGEFGDGALRRRHYEMKVEVLRGPDGRQTAAFMTSFDITERLREQAALAEAQEALRQAQKMEAVGQLTGGLAHDFNNLLLGVSGSLQLMRRKFSTATPAELDRFVEIALGATRRAAALTHRLLAFSRRQTLDPKPLKLDRLAASMEELVRRTIGPGIALEVRSDTALWTVLADPGQLENALLNLCINGRDAMPDGGTLSIATSNRTVSEATAREWDLAPGPYVAMCVTDNGSGMASDVVARAFDPFFTTKPIGLGTGLGLSMVYGFARQSGGQVRIDSTPGKGTTVCIYLPRNDAEEVQANEVAAPEPATPLPHARTVLVVDDEEAVRSVVVEAMQDLGFHVVAAADGAQALDRLEANRDISLMISDVGLPGGINGRQLADRARVLRPSLKVLFITGYAESAVLGAGHLAPGMHVLTKPFELDSLARKIGVLMEN